MALASYISYAYACCFICYIHRNVVFVKDGEFFCKRGNVGGNNWLQPSTEPNDSTVGRTAST